MTNEEALETCKAAKKAFLAKFGIFKDSDGAKEFVEMMRKLYDIDTMIDSLEKQIPKRPNLEGDGYDDNGYMIYDTWICPCCEKSYEVDYDKYDFCPNCGQAIDWSNDDDTKRNT